MIGGTKGKQCNKQQTLLKMYDYRANIYPRADFCAQRHKFNKHK